jgi:hypothetical protein
MVAVQGMLEQALLYSLDSSTILFIVSLYLWTDAAFQITEVRIFDKSCFFNNFSLKC